MPDQSTLWCSRERAFTTEFRETVETTARTILIKAQNAGVEVPRDPERKLRRHYDEFEGSEPDDQTALEQAERITDHVSRVISRRSRMICQRGLSDLGSKRMQTSEKAQAEWLLRRDQDRYETDRKLHLGTADGTRRR